MASLYEINKTYLEVLENGFKIDEETGEILFDKDDLERIESEFSEKVDNIACYIKDLLALNEAIKNEKKNLDDRMNTNTKKIEWLKSYLSWSMKVRELDKYETPRSKISYRSSKKVEVTDLEQIPAEFIKTKTESSIDKKAVMEAFKNGQTVNGVEIIESRNIQIK